MNVAILTFYMKIRLEHLLIILLGLFFSIPVLVAAQSQTESLRFNEARVSIATGNYLAKNLSEDSLVLPAPLFSHKHGFYHTPFDLEITSELSDVLIYYTTDGSEPRIDNGTVYKSPIKITTTTVLRGVVLKSGILKSKITTSTYLFPDDVIKQTNNPAGYPSQWGVYVEEQGIATADYEMDPEVTRDSRYVDFMEDALLQIPTLSIVTDKNNIFSHVNDPEKGGIYIYTGADGYNIGRNWERPVSVEYFDNTGLNEFQIDCGLEIHGGASRLPDKTPKHSLRLAFRKEYGESKLNYPLFGDSAVSSFNSLVLRANYGNTWLHRSNSERLHAQLIHDTWGKDTQLEMGQPAGHGIFVHLYINGIYWGIYNPTERINDDFCEDYFGGNKEDYDVIKDYGEVANGNITAWNKMMSMSKTGMADNAEYQRIQGNNPDGTDNPQYEAYLDVVNFIDYMLINYYGANWDWDAHNWVAARNRVEPGKGFKFFSWDAEHICEKVTANNLGTNNENQPTGLFNRLLENAEFRRLFADRVQLHCFNGGALTPEATNRRWMKRANQIDMAIIAESARWGDYRRDVHRSYSSGPFDLYTKEHWLSEQSFIINQYFPNRVNEFIKQLKLADLFPEVNAPQMLINDENIKDNNINKGDKLSLKTSGGEIYYTIDGSDPVQGSEPSPNALVYSNPIELTHSFHIKARTFYRDIWSALIEKSLILQIDLTDLKVTEIHYHPLPLTTPADTIDDNNFEFIELKNTGTSQLDLSGTRFIEGITYDFPVNTMLEPGLFLILSSDEQYFNQRYSFNPFGEYGGSLDNSGERIVLVKADGDTVFSIRYNDKTPWPESADGEGYSLVPIELNPAGDQDNPEKWSASSAIHGSPGKDDDVSTGIDNLTTSQPVIFKLSQNYPNPFNPSTTIKYTVPVGTRHGVFVQLKVYDVLGKEVAVLVNKIMPAGTYNITWHAGNLPSGVYFYKITAGNFSKVNKMLLLR